MASAIIGDMLAYPILLAVALAQQPAPQPFPRPGGSQPARPQTPAPRPAEPPAAPAQPPTAAPAPAAPAVAAPGGPTEATLGAPIYPGAQFLTSYDAGRGQRFYIFGSSASFLDLVAYYRTALKQKGDLVFEAPATHEFGLGKYREETMAFPPSVTIKEYKSELSEGYPNPKPGGQPTRFPTIIQVVPAPAAAPR